MEPVRGKRTVLENLEDATGFGGLDVTSGSTTEYSYCIFFTPMRGSRTNWHNAQLQLLLRFGQKGDLCGIL